MPAPHNQPVVAGTPAARESPIALVVDVRALYERGQRARGFDLVRGVDAGNQVRRPGSLDVLPEVFVPTR